MEMQSAVSVSFFRPELSDFLYASVSGESDEMPLSVLSALARLNLDPWSEAAELSALPREGATQRLAILIARLPGTRWTQDDCRAIAERLVKLLPRIKKSDKTAKNTGTTRLEAILSLPDSKLIILLIALVFLVMAVNGGQ